MSSHLAFRRGRAFAVLALLFAGAPAFAQQCPPQANIQAVAQAVDEGATVKPNGQSSKPNDATYLWERVSGPGPITFSPNATSANVQFVAPQVTGDQQLVIRLTVTGCNPLRSHSTEAIVTIRDTTPPSNTAPTAVASATPPIAGAGVSVTLDGSQSTDPEQNALTYIWEQIDGPTVTLANATSAFATFTAPNLPTSATLKFRLTVTDTGGLKSQADVVVNVPFENDNPLARLSCPATVQEGQSVTLDASASTDFEDGTLLAYDWSQLLGPPNIPVALQHGSSVTFNAPVLGTGDLGLVTFEVTVTDSGALYDTAECSVFIEDVTAPVFSGDGNRTAEATGPAGATVTYDGLVAIDNVEGDVTPSIVCVPPSGSLFAITTSNVHCVVADLNGNGAEANFQVLVQDTTAPTLTVPGDIAVEADGPGGSVVTFVAESSDIVDGTKDATCVPPSGSLFPLGDTEVACSAVDAHGNAATPKSFDVSVMDTKPPVIAPHDDINDVEATSAAGAVVTYDAPQWTDIVDGTGTATCVPASGATFKLGTTTVACDHTDNAGNPATTVIFDVEVVDTTAPVIASHANIEDVEATSAAGAVVHYDAPLWTDAVDGTGSAACLPASGSTFALGTTTVTCRKTDNAGNIAAPKMFTVEVVDTTPPVIVAHSNIAGVEATGPGGAAVTYVAPLWTDAVSGSGSATCLPASGSTFALGTTIVTCNAMDGAGNAAVPTTFTIQVVDTTAPVIAPHADVTAIAPADSQAIVHYTDPTATDVVDGTVSVSCDPASGATFGVGTTAIHCEAIDQAGNKATSTFNVIVSYAFTGFFSPVDNLPVVNTVTAGQSVPVKFSLGGYQGMAIFAAGYPKSTVMACSGATQDALEETSTAGSSTLTFDPTTGRYHYVWKTEKAWSSTCRQLQLKFADGTVKVANFYFKK